MAISLEPMREQIEQIIAWVRGLGLTGWERNDVYLDVAGEIQTAASRDLHAEIANNHFRAVQLHNEFKKRNPNMKDLPKYR